MTNRDLQQQLLRLLGEDYTVLAESERFVHQIQLQYRRNRIEQDMAGWEHPKILTLNRWLDTFWNSLWPDEWPASSLHRWKTLGECLEDSPPPEPLSVDIGLIHLLDESFELSLRYGMDPGGGEAANRLIEWKREIWRSFAGRLSQAGLFHPAQLPEKIAKTLDGTAPSGKMAFVGFEFAGYWEKQLLKELQKKTGGAFFNLPAGKMQPETLVYSNPEQEITVLMENLLVAAKECALHEIAVVLLDSRLYSPALSNLLQSLLGDPLSADRAAYNLCPDKDLSEQPLFKAMLLPGKFAMDGEMRQDLFALLRSPYYGFFSQWSRRLSSWDRIWRNRRIESGIDSLLRAVHDSARELFPLGGDEIRTSLAPFQSRSKREVSSWTADLRKIWATLEFPVLANELDQICWQHITRILSDFEAAFQGKAITGSEFNELLTAAASRAAIQRTGVEDAGIQILSRLDARGLVFRKIFVPGFVSGAFPQPARSLPFLTASERKNVLGGTIESQFIFARYIYGNWFAAAPEITLSRPAMGNDGDLCLPSPFWTAESEKNIPPVIPWKDKLPAMQRARWVQQSVSGISTSGREPVIAAIASEAPDFRVMPLPLTRPITVSQLQSAMLCPAQFFFQHIIQLEELDEFEPGIPPRERGQAVHKILATFVSRAVGAFETGDQTFEGLCELLEQTAMETLKPHLPEAVWLVERERLIGKPGQPGLLLKWLEEEWKRLAEGWSWMSVESGFDSMEIRGCTACLKGRLDRIDSHPALGFVCWDYKTGSIPGKKELTADGVQPQLRAYLLALSKGVVVGVRKGGRPCGAGYIELSSPGKTKHQLIFDPDAEDSALLADWENRVADVLNAIIEGNVAPLWLTEGRPCEEKCAFKGVCGSP
ncbi:MAG: PD-(D/E)XK nuclease family protein [Syntrophobacteraceae bacterium]